MWRGAGRCRRGGVEEWGKGGRRGTWPVLATCKIRVRWKGCRILALFLLALPGPDLVLGGQFQDESENHREVSIEALNSYF